MRPPTTWAGGRGLDTRPRAPDAVRDPGLLLALAPVLLAHRWLRDMIRAAARELVSRDQA